ncbi:YraN family protein [Winogradskyella undariae]|uniref:YraN family protein n=1 Tax=Winogradskyella TaxID=286104 RepID=UPI00156B8EB1|nr:MULTISPECIES: YraN family protein [Winogradskyella]NRR93283.1 YraN family protein [Winogradskyella undariae]QNK77039.1 YraN family protein [Winogradskyella sp. PAMC22761]QXP80380.1 YraN family protein [Winogradskyella sp. HaHa_3_26]
MAEHNELGQLGEQLATDYLIKKGYEIVERNYVFQKAEIDIIAKHNGFMVCVEVKTRNSDFFGDPQEFVTPSKIKLLVKAMDEYITSNAIDLETRFDITAVLKNKTTEKITHYEDAFYHF